MTHLEDSCIRMVVYLVVFTRFGSDIFYLSDIIQNQDWEDLCIKVSSTCSDFLYDPNI